MRVAVFALFSDAACDPESKCWLEQLIRALAQNSSINQLVLYTNEAQLARLNDGNLLVKKVKPALFFWNRWRQRRLWRRQLEQHNIAAVLFFGLQSVFTAPFSCYLLLQPADVGRKRLLRQQLQPGAFKQVFVANEAAMEKIVHALDGHAINMSVLHGAPPVQSLVEADVQLIKDRFTDGAEYFLCHGSLNDIAFVILLLKAFSRFKHRQKSGWKLVLAPEETGKIEALLSRYKYRQDVVVAHRPGAEVAQALYAGAYCFVHPGAPPYFGTILLQALSRGLPVIATPGCREWAGAAALYFEPGNEEGLAAHLMTLYKDEALRQRLAQAAVQRAAHFSWQPLLQPICKNGQQAETAAGQ